MKLLLASLLAVASFSAFSAEIVSCRVAKVYNDNIFEEGLSVREYPEVSLYQSGRNFELKLGMMQRYSTKTGGYVALNTAGPKVMIAASYKGETATVFIQINKVPADNGMRWGQLAYREDGQSRVQAVALLICK